MTDPTPDAASAAPDPARQGDTNKLAVVGVVAIVLAGLIAAKLGIDADLVEKLCGAAVTGLFAVIQRSR